MLPQTAEYAAVVDSVKVSGDLAYTYLPEHDIHHFKVLRPTTQSVDDLFALLTALYRYNIDHVSADYVFKQWFVNGKISQPFQYLAQKLRAYLRECPYVYHSRVVSVMDNPAMTTLTNLLLRYSSNTKLSKTRMFHRSAPDAEIINWLKANWDGN